MYAVRLYSTQRNGAILISVLLSRRYLGSFDRLGSQHTRRATLHTSTKSGCCTLVRRTIATYLLHAGVASCPPGEQRVLSSRLQWHLIRSRNEKWATRQKVSVSTDILRIGESY
jgi:hypothetical protein